MEQVAEMTQIQQHQMEDFQDLDLQELIQSGFMHLVEVAEEQEIIPPEMVLLVVLVVVVDQVVVDQHQTEELVEQHKHPPIH